MKKEILLVVFFIGIIALPAEAQFNRYIIRFKNKTETPFSINNPSQFLSQRALERRSRQGIAVDETDLPITPRYLDSIAAAGNVILLNVSKWLNQVCIYSTDADALAKINAFDFVLSEAPIAARVNPAVTGKNKLLDPFLSPLPATPSTVQQTDDVYDYGLSYDQVHLHNGEFLHNLGFRGQGMQIAVIDDGFANYLTLPAFDSVRNNNQVLETWDFVANNSSVNEDDSHGMKCFSAIAANMPGSFVGTAPAASFYLYRTEDLSSEYPVEEQNWAAAAERADSLGADVLTTSLGYTTFTNSFFNHSYADLDGNSTLMAKAANLAARKGLLVLAAVGNDGNSSWHYLSTAGDADSALTIGAVNSSRQVASFSSYGPNSNGQVKPDLAAIGVNAVVAGTSTGSPVYGNGTSFATPIMAGIVTCLAQAFPEMKNMNLVHALQASSDNFQQPDDRTGYGVPDVKKAFVDITRQLQHNSAGINQCNVTFNFGVKAGNNMQVVIERKLPSDNFYQPISSFSFSGHFQNRLFSYTDTLNNFTSGVSIDYRYKMVIGTDTSFYLDSTSLFYQQQCNPVSVRKICPGAATYLSVDSATGYSSKWQVNPGTGYVDLADNMYYQGTASRVLLLKNLPRNFYGYQYRCLQQNGSNSLVSDPVTLKFTSSWTGAASTAWEDPANWQCGAVPDQYTDAVVDSESPNYPFVNFNAGCHALYCSPGVSVTVKSGQQLVISGQ